jgi:hypothetical protein
VWQNECNFIDLKQFNLWGPKLKLKQIYPFFFAKPVSYVEKWLARVQYTPSCERGHDTMVVYAKSFMIQ